MIRCDVIPRIIHHVWIDPDFQPSTLQTVPMDVLDNLLAWTNLETNYRQKIWLIHEIIDLCQKQNLHDIATAIRSCRFPSMKADIARLLLLQVFGGFWADLKLHPNLRFLDRFSGYDLVLTEHFPKDDLPDPTGHISNSFIGAVPSNPVIVRALQTVVENVNNRMAGSIYHVSGATNLMNAIKEVGERGAYFLLPHQTAWDYFFTIRGGSYNKSNMHWSLREQRECPYEEIL
jgi:mannosyltransferase OCH1-like enzyme